MKNKIIITPKKKPELFREWIAFKLVALANWIRPGNEAGIAYFMGLMQEAELEKMKYGKSIMQIKVKKHKKFEFNL